jgi:hypothetical protein
MDGFLRVLWARALPELVDGPFDMDERAAMHQQQSQERERATTGHTAAATPYGIDFDRPEDPELGVHLPREPIPARRRE